PALLCKPDLGLHPHQLHPRWPDLLHTVSAPFGVSCRFLCCRVVFPDVLPFYPLQLILWQHTKEVPRDGKGLFDRPVFIALRDKLPLKNISELQVFPVKVGQSLFANNRDKPAQVAPVRVRGVQLVCDTTVILPGLARAYTEVHEPGQAGEGIDWRVATAPEDIPRENDLAFGDIA